MVDHYQSDTTICYCQTSFRLLLLSSSLLLPFYPSIIKKNEKKIIRMVIYNPSPLDWHQKKVE